MRNFLRLGLFAALFAAAAVITSCGKDSTDDSGKGTTPTANDEDLNRWMLSYMKTHYLWNSAVKPLTPDYSLGYEDFLSDVLVKVAAQNDINHDDGHWEGGQRAYFYSNIQRFKATKSRMGSTRGTHQTAQSTGIEFMVARNLPGYPSYFFSLLAIAPGSPAQKAGFVRGSIITKVDGESINAGNYRTLGSKIATSLEPMRLTPATIIDDKVVEKQDITITAATFNDNPVWEHRVIDVNGKKIGYLCYNTFNYYYDSNLIAVFTEFKQAGVTELILDLRYNGGGHVYSSAVLGTLIAGSTKKDQVYTKTTFNQDRQNAGEKIGIYKIGNANIQTTNYQPIATALGSALDLNTIYMLATNNTASASELVVNGLRGLDLTVRLIGETTNGKNVGMEPVTKTKDGYEYEFSPITMSVENAKGFNDYSSGFAPDVAVDEYRYSIESWGSELDPMVAIALRWITTGSKPSPAAVLKTRSESRILEVAMPPKALEGMIVLRGEE